MGFNSGFKGLNKLSPRYPVFLPPKGVEGEATGTSIWPLTDVSATFQAYAAVLFFLRCLALKDGSPETSVNS